jgi:thiamine biosynthesis lipoprotein
VLRAAWDFSRGCLPGQDAVEALLPRIGLDKVVVSGGRLHFGEAGMELDFGGLAKEYAADRAAEVCASIGARHGFVDLAGDIRVVGLNPMARLGWSAFDILATRSFWSRKSRCPQALWRPAGTTNASIDGRHYCHLLDPRAGWPAQGLSSVTVISDRCLVAGSLSTIAMLKGRQGIEWLRQLGVRHFAVTEERQCHGTEDCLTRCS